jgi:uncharacterized protein (DUF2141 family)
MRAAMLLLLGTLPVSLPTAAAAAKDLRVLVSGIQSDQGEIACLLFKEEAGFPVEAERAFNRVNYPAVEGMLTCTFPDVAPGRYAVSVIHDENGNAKVDTTFLGFSKEPWGVTNNVRPARRAPRFGEAAIWIEDAALADYEVVLER